MNSQKKHIRYVSRASLDTGLWDQCIRRSPNGVIYALSAYLDNMAPHWDGLVMGDYEAVMPLTWNRKWGISYLYQPAFTQRLGVFSGHTPEADLVEPFLEVLRKKFRFAEIFFHEGNPIPHAEKKNNYCLSLSRPYFEIRAGYKKSLLRNLKQAEENDLEYQAGQDYQEAIDVFRTGYAGRIPHLNAGDFRSFAALCQEAGRRNMLEVIKVNSPAGHLLASGIFFHDGKKIYNILPSSLPEGRKLGAGHFLMDRLIREYSGMNLVLDLEGSDIPGIRSFYEKFGALNKPYYFFRYNHLPYPLRLLKKRST